MVFIPKRRKKLLYGNLRRHLGEVLHKLAQQKECRIEEGHLLAPCTIFFTPVECQHARNSGGLGEFFGHITPLRVVQV